MATNLVHKPGYELSVVASHPALPLSGQPVRFGDLTGVALTDERADGTVTADFGPGVWNLSVRGHDGSSNSAVAVGDPLFYVDGIIGAGTGPLNKNTTGRFFGFAMAIVGSGDTETIPVMSAPSPGIVTVEPSSVSPTKVALASGEANDFAFAWQNPEDVAILVHRVFVDVTTAGGTGSSVMDVGAAATATTASDSIIDGMDLNDVHVVDHLLVGGAGVGGVHKLDENGGTTDWITGRILVANAASLAGNVYIMYTRV